MEESLQFLEANKYLIRYYYVYKHKSFLRAAENFYVSGTDRNMKYAVTQLENFYGVQLINVKGNKLTFTEFGHILGKQSKKVYDNNIEINSILQRSNLKEVRIATSFDFYKYYIKPVFAVFQKDNPDSKIILIKTNQYDATDRLLKREIDFIIGTNEVNPHPELTYDERSKAKILLAVKKENEAKYKNINSLVELKKIKGAINDQTDPFYHNFQYTTAEACVDLNIVYYTSDFESLIEIVRIGNYKYFSDLSFIDVSHLFKPVIISFIYRKGESQSMAIKNLINISSKLNIKPV